jgi:hypothetical protein
MTRIAALDPAATTGETQANLHVIADTEIDFPVVPVVRSTAR